jgi:hypothetical protein
MSEIQRILRFMRIIRNTACTFPHNKADVPQPFTQGFRNIRFFISASCVRRIIYAQTLAANP